MPWSSAEASEAKTDRPLKEVLQVPEKKRPEEGERGGGGGGGELVGIRWHVLLERTLRRPVEYEN